MGRLDNRIAIVTGESSGINGQSITVDAGGRL